MGLLVWDGGGLMGGGLLGGLLGAHLALSAGTRVGSRNRNQGSGELLIKSRRRLQGHCPLPPALVVFWRDSSAPWAGGRRQWGQRSVSMYGLLIAPSGIRSPTIVSSGLSSASGGTQNLEL